MPPMNKYDDEDFNISEFEHRQRRRRKRLMTIIAAGAIVALIGMVIFWK